MPDARATLETALSGTYVFERELGRGGMATVYLARDLKHDRLVALKVLDPELAQALGPERFIREIHLAARLQHPHILTVHDSGEAGGVTARVRENGGSWRTASTMLAARDGRRRAPWPAFHWPTRAATPRPFGMGSWGW